MECESVDTESGTSTNNQDLGEKTNELNTKLTKKDSRIAFDATAPEDLSRYSQNKNNRNPHKTSRNTNTNFQKVFLLAPKDQSSRLYNVLKMTAFCFFSAKKV